MPRIPGDFPRLPSRGLRESKKERTKAALSEAAVQLASENGYDATTIESIAAATDVSVRTFHNYFPSKFDAFTHGLIAIVERYTTYLTAIDDDVSCLDAICQAWIDLLADDEQLQARLPLLLDVVNSTPGLKPLLADDTDRIIQPVLNEIARRTGTEIESSIVPWIGFDMAFSVIQWLSLKPYVDRFGDMSPTEIIDSGLSALAILQTTRKN